MCNNITVAIRAQRFRLVAVSPLIVPNQIDWYYFDWFDQNLIKIEKRRSVVFFRYVCLLNEQNRPHGDRPRARAVVDWFNSMEHSHVCIQMQTWLHSRRRTALWVESDLPWRLSIRIVHTHTAHTYTRTYTHIRHTYACLATFNSFPSCYPVWLISSCIKIVQISISSIHIMHHTSHLIQRWCMSWLWTTCGTRVLVSCVRGCARGCVRATDIARGKTR